MLVDCEVSDQARRAAGLGNIFDAWFQQVSTAQELVHAICSGEDKDKAGMFAMLVWTLWNNRNNKVWNDASKTGRNIGFKARQLWEEWNAVKKLQHGGQQLVPHQQLLRWQKAMHGSYKCNVDAGASTCNSRIVDTNLMCSL
jgi:hypothetical protein